LFLHLTENLKSQNLINPNMIRVERNIHKRVTACGVERFIVRIGDPAEPTGFFFYGTFGSLELARRIRDEEQAAKALSRKQASKENRDSQN
jgi:hypothetical protein